MTFSLQPLPKTMTTDMVQEMSIQDCCVTHLKSVPQYKVHQPWDLHSSEHLFYSPMSCIGAHSIMTSMYKSVQYHGQCVQEHTASWLAFTGVYSIMASVYRSTQHHDQHVQECTVSWPVCTGAHSIMATIYKSILYHGRCVQEHTASWPACTRV
jgi:hypothetical protein